MGRQGEVVRGEGDARGRDGGGDISFRQVPDRGGGVRLLLSMNIFSWFTQNLKKPLDSNNRSDAKLVFF